MKTRLAFFVAVVGILLLALGMFTGCKTTPPIDWNARVGNYTYDQAIVELGPPNKTARLSTGETVAEWVTGQREHSSVSFGTGFFSGGHHGGTGVGVGQTVGGGYSDKVLRLTFAAADRLVAWSKNY
jgi:hypothetical protein